MILYQKTFENTMTLDCNFPIEDQFYAQDDFAVVADGIARDPIGFPDLSQLSLSEMIEHYPRPSGGELAAKEVIKYAQDFVANSALSSFLIEANKKIKQLNEQVFPVCDYLENDFCGTVASCCYLEGNTLHYAYICDCGIIIYDSHGQIKFQTEDDKETYSDAYINKIGIPWHLPEARVIVRRDYRNNLDNLQDGRCISYGALTGEESAQYFVRSGSIEIEDTDIIVTYSDGYTNYLSDPNFISLLLDFDEEKLDKYILQQSKVDYNLYGKEKTMVIMKK